MASPFSSQEPTPEDSRAVLASTTQAQHHCQRPVVSSDFVHDLLWQIETRTRHDAPLRDLPSLTADKIHLSTGSDSIPYIAPLLDPATFNIVLDVVLQEAALNLGDHLYTYSPRMQDKQDKETRS